MYHYRACLHVWLYSSSSQFSEFKIWKVQIDGLRDLVLTLQPYMDSNTYWPQGTWKEMAVLIESSEPYQVGRYNMCPFACVIDNISFYDNIKYVKLKYT